MSIRPDWWIRERAREGMIDPFVDHLERDGVINCGLSSFGYDLRAAPEWRIFVNAFNTLVDPKHFDARCGIVANVTPLEPGWEGHVTLELSNTTPLPATIYAFEGIVQLLFFQRERPESTYADRKGKYQGQRGVTLPKL